MLFLYAHQCCPCSLQVYAAETYTPLAEFGKGELDEPTGVCVTSEGLVAVSSCGDHKIFVF